MEFLLSPHADHPPVAVRSIEVEVRGCSGSVSLAYRLVGGDQVVRPSIAPPTRTDDLWRTTCFELFLRFDDDERYVEFNFSPSTQWAAYAFEGYREGMAALDIVAPRIQRTSDGVTVALDLTGLPRGDLRMALTAVIEEEGGVKSYWSLAHPPGAPDFHHPACFAATLPPPETP